MYKGKTVQITLRRKDLIDAAYRLPLADVELHHVGVTLRDVYRAERVVLMDYTGQTKILKDRFPNEVMGLVVERPDTFQMFDCVVDSRYGRVQREPVETE